MTQLRPILLLGSMLFAVATSTAEALAQASRPTLPPRPAAAEPPRVAPPEQPAPRAQAGPSPGPVGPASWDIARLTVDDGPPLRTPTLSPQDAAANIAAWYSNAGRVATCPVAHVRVHAIQTLPALGQVDVHYVLQVPDGFPECDAWRGPQRLEIVSVPAENLLDDIEWYVPAWTRRLMKP